MTMRDALISFPMFGEGFVINPPAYISIGTLRIYFYGLIIAAGFLLAVVYASRVHDRLGMKMDDIYDLILFAVPSAIVGSRLYYVIFEWRSYADDLTKIFAIRDGGLAIYGAVIGAVIAVILRSRKLKISIWRPLDVASFGLLIGQCVGRWGNFFNREAYGYETDVFCRMGLTLGGSTVYVHPTFLYESLWNLAGFIAMHLICKKRRRYEGQFFILYVFWYGLGRMFIEGLRTDSLWLVPDVIRVSQLLAALSMLAALVVYILNDKRLKRGLRPLAGAPIPAEGEGEPVLDEGDIMIVEAAAAENAASEAEPDEENGENGENKENSENRENQDPDEKTKI